MWKEIPGPFPCADTGFFVARPELVELRNETGVDYGRFDYVMVDGNPVVYDINRTPTSSPAAVAHYVPQ